MNYNITEDFNWDSGKTEYKISGKDYESYTMYSHREAMEHLKELLSKASCREPWATPLNH